jgi:pimeloyl-ACP methyl ester carboxylesterase
MPPVVMQPMPAGVRLVIRHGICSNGANMGILRQELLNRLGWSFKVVDNQTYDWEDTILRNGVELAKTLLAAPAADGVAIVGHSMGGLVCRIANCALTDPNFLNVVDEHKAEFDPAIIRQVLARPLGQHRVGSIVLLATPNSGAMTHSQTAILAHLLQGAANRLQLALFAKSDGIADLRTDRIFRILQHCRTPTPCLTVSGSWGNRFLRGIKGSAYHRLLQWAANMREPHDQIVEDESVDLGRSILPHEFTAPPEHQRAYADCTDVTHTNIHETDAVHDLTADFIRNHP